MVAGFKNPNTRIKCVLEKIINRTDSLDATCDIYNNVVTYLLKVMYQEFPMDFKEDTCTVTTVVEALVHHTKSHPYPKYSDFDELFVKLPTYFRRAAIASAYGKWSSWRSNYLSWELEKKEIEEKGKRFTKKSPTPQMEHKDYPVLYKGNVFKQEENGYKIKAYINNDWVWVDIKVKKKVDLKRRGIESWKQCSPKLIKKGSKYFLAFSFEKVIPLHDKEAKDTRILAIDLGLTNTAVCCVMESDGTVLARKFIKQAKEKDHLYHLTNQLRKAQRQTKNASCPRYWNAIKGIQKHIVNNVSAEIMKFAIEYKVDTIVFEHLGNMKMPKGFYGAKGFRFKLHYWRKISIQNKVMEMCHYQGMRLSRVFAGGTSKYAYDGSGEVTRSKRKDLCVFSTGKRYHADLNASYNIGARFYLRAITKPLSEKARLKLGAKVPSVLIGTMKTLDTLIKVNNVFGLI